MLREQQDKIIEYFIQNGLYLIPLHSITIDGKCTCGEESCHSPGKHPLKKYNWKLLASNDPKKIKGWFGKGKANVGIATGRKSKTSGQYLICVDIDLTEHELLQQLQQNNTFWYETGGGGYHFWYWSDMPVRNSVSLIADKVDIRGTNGYVVAPPSKHVSGKEYVLRSEITQPIASIPVFLLDLLKESYREAAATTKKQNKKEKKPQIVDKITEEWSKIPVQNIRDIMQSGTLIPLGARNVTLHRLLSSDRARGVALKQCLIVKAEEYRKHFEDPDSFPDQELELVVNSCMRYPAYNNAHEKVNECYISWLTKCGIEFTVDFPTKLQKLDDEFFKKLEPSDSPVPLVLLTKAREDFLKKNGLERTSNYRPQLFAKKLKELGFNRIRNSKGNLWEVRLNYSVEKTQNQ